jgi:hypothetical protein
VDGYEDLVFKLPSCLTKDDYEILIEKNMKLTDIVIEETHIFSEKYLENIKLKFKEKIIQKLYD